MKKKRSDIGAMQRQRKNNISRQLKDRKIVLTKHPYPIYSSERISTVCKTSIDQPEKKKRVEFIVPKTREKQEGKDDNFPRVRNNDRRVPNGTMTCSIGLRIEHETNEKLIDLCFREGISKSALIKRLIRQYIDENVDE